MREKNRTNGKQSQDHGLLIIGYDQLGVIPIEELRDALIEDMQALKDIYNIHYINSSRLKILATNEYGEAVKIRRPRGGSITYLDTHHFRPACRDYDL